MKLLDDYFDLQKQIYDYFGYKEDWVVFPIEDATEYYWCLPESDDESDEVHFAESKENLEKIIANGFEWEGDGIDEHDYYSNEIIAPFLPSGVYRGKDFTMICIDTETDGNRLLQIFDNVKEIKVKVNG
jgi:hypothetical protein